MDTLQHLGYNTRPDGLGWAWREFESVRPTPVTITTEAGQTAGLYDPLRKKRPPRPVTTAEAEAARAALYRPRPVTPVTVPPAPLRARLDVAEEGEA